MRKGKTKKKEKNGSATPKHRKKKEREQKTASEDAEKIALLFPFSLQPAEQIKMTTRKKNSFFQLVICYLCVLVCLRLCVLETKKKKESCQFFFSSILRKARRSFPFFFATEEHKKKGVFSFVNRKKGSNKNKLFGSSCRRRPPLFLSCSVCVKACQLHLFRFQNRHALNVEDKLGQCAR